MKSFIAAVLASVAVADYTQYAANCPTPGDDFYCVDRSKNAGYVYAFNGGEYKTCADDICIKGAKYNTSLKLPTSWPAVCPDAFEAEKCFYLGKNKLGLPNWEWVNMCMYDRCSKME